MKRSAVLGSALLSCVVLGLATRDLRPPSPAPLDAPPPTFSGDRAFEHVLRIASAPHPMGSVEHGRVRDYVVETFRRLGLDVAEHAGVVARRASRADDGAHVAYVTNVVARLRGSAATGRDVVLAAHYDSVPTGPGAGDDAAAVGALIEVARALREGPSLANDVVFLITDGEEVGLYGAKLAVEDPAFLSRTALVLNFEARGHRGPVVMFQTFGAVAPWVDALAHVDDPVAYSLAADVYERMPNDTDLTVFGRAGLPGMNFAFIGGHSHYHTPLDAPAELDRGSLQHHGQYALALARHFGAADLGAAAIGAKRAGDEQVYFSLWRATLVHWPGAWALPIAYGVLGLAVLTLVLAIARRRTCLGSFTLELLAVALALVLPGALFLIDGGQRDGGSPLFSAAAQSYAPGRILLAYLLGSAAVAILVVRWRARGTLPLAVAVVWSVLAVVVTRDAPAGSVLAFAALPVVLLEAARVLRPAASADVLPSWTFRIGAAVVASVVAAIFAPLCGLLPSAIGPHVNGLAAALAVVTALACSRLWQDLVAKRAGLACAAAVAAALVVAIPIVRAPYGEQWPQPVAPHTVTSTGTENGWTRTVLGDAVDGGVRSVVVRLTPPIGTWRSSIRLRDRTTSLTRVRIGDREERGISALLLDGNPPQGIEVELRVRVGEPVTIEAYALVPTTGRAHPAIAPHATGQFAAPNRPDGIEVRQSFDL